MSSSLEIYLKYFGSTKWKNTNNLEVAEKEEKQLQNMGDIKLSVERYKQVCKIRREKTFQAIHRGVKVHGSF